MTEIETTGATPAPKRRRAARKPVDGTAETSPPKRTTRKRTPVVAPPPTAGAPESTARASRPRARRIATVTPPVADPPAPAMDTREPPPAEPVATSSGGAEGSASDRPAEDAGGVTSTLEFAPPVDAAPPAPQELPDNPSSGTAAPPEHASSASVIDFPPAGVRHPASRSRPARPTFKQTVLQAAADRFRGDPVREPVTADQVDEMLVLLHKPGVSRSLKDATYDFLRRGMSRGHAKKQIEKLRAPVVAADERIAA